MGNDLMSLLLDVVVLMLLGVTIFYVIRLTKGLQDFKKHRQEFDSIIANLLSSIDQADHSVRMLKKVSSEEVGQLEDSIIQAKALSDELRIISEAGESMAKRLEKLAETNRKIVQPSFSISGSPVEKFRREESRNVSSSVYRRKPKRSKSAPASPKPLEGEPAIDEDKQSSSYDSTLKRVSKSPSNSIKKEEYPSFMIKDKEFEDLDSLENRLDSSVSNDGVEPHDEEDVMPKNLQSQAEKELFEALRNSKKNISKSGK